MIVAASTIAVSSAPAGAEWFPSSAYSTSPGNAARARSQACPTGATQAGSRPAIAVCKLKICSVSATPRRGHSGNSTGTACAALAIRTSDSAPAVEYAYCPLVLYFCACSTTKSHDPSCSSASDPGSPARSSRNIHPGASANFTVLPGRAARIIAATISGKLLNDVWLLPMNSTEMSAGVVPGAADPLAAPPPQPAITRHTSETQDRSIRRAPIMDVDPGASKEVSRGMPRLRRLVLLGSLHLACGDSSGGDTTTGEITSATAPPPTTTTPAPTTGEPGTTSGSGDASTAAGLSTGATTDVPLLDLGQPDFGGPACAAAEHTPCDEPDGDPLRAIGLNCPGELQVEGGFDGDPVGLRVLPQWGSSATFTPREGNSILVISTGDLAELGDVPADEGDVAYHCNSWFAGGDGMDTTKFPPPIIKDPAEGDCLQDPAAVGTGDCSHSIEPQFDQSGFKYDYQEVRFTATVPPGAVSLSFDVAFLTKEYPIWKDRPYNDMFIGWLEASNWTGNIAFDAQGNPLSLNAAFLELHDDAGDLPEFAGTCMRYSAGTRWLTTTAAVVPGDQISLVFAIFDLDDVNWDSFVLLDNLRWGCGDVGGPVTEPAG